MSRKKVSPSPADTPILAYTSISERSLNLPESVMATFEAYSRYFQEKAGYDLSAGDVVAAKGTELFTQPEKIKVPKTESKSDQKLSLPNSAWAGIDHAAKCHESTPDMIVETLAKNLTNDEAFVRWQKKQSRVAKKSVH